MGLFYEPLDVSADRTGAVRRVEALVDTGAIYTSLPVQILRELGVQPELRMPFIFADGRRLEMDRGTIFVRIDGRQTYTPCIFGSDDSTPILGAVTLEELGLGVDPVNRKLIEVPGIMMELS
jgi:clan AA aspartic protease